MASRAFAYSRLTAIVTASLLAFACSVAKPKASAPPCSSDENGQMEDGGAPIPVPPPQYGNRVANVPAR